MLFTPAYAQDASSAADPFGSILVPMLLMLVIFYFFLIRPQQRKLRQHQEMLKALKRNDVVVTAGGILAKVRNPGNPEDQEIEVEISDNVRVKLMRSTLASVRSKTD